MGDTLHSRLFAFIRQHNVLNLAYTDGDGPGACAVWFAPDQSLACYFLSSTSTRHGSALLAGGPVAFTIQKDEQPWQAIRGVQGRGHCSPLMPDEQPDAWDLYVARFPFVTQQFPDLEAALARTRIWRITPTWLRLIDNSIAFGHKEEMVLG